MNSLSNLPLKDLSNIKNKILSIYPLIYYKINRYKNINFDLGKYNKFFNEIVFSNYNLKQLNNKVINFLYNEIIVKNQIKEEGIDLIYGARRKYFYNKVKIDFLNLSKIFFAYDFATKDKLLKHRLETIKKTDFKNFEKELDSIFFNHDGWWNNYYGPIIDIRGKKILERALKEKNLLKKYKRTEAKKYIRLFLTLAYRYNEIGEIKKARKIARKGMRFLRFKLARTQSFDNMPIYIKNPILKIIYKFIASRIFYSRFKMNFEMFLYRSETNLKKKKRIINKILNKTLSEEANLLQEILSHILHKKPITFISVAQRPQHILKQIEIRSDQYILSNDKEKKNILVWINYLVIEFVRSLKVEFYSQSSIYLYYFIISEFFLTIFYFLEKTKNIDIGNY